MQELQKIADLKTVFISELSSHAGQNCTLVITVQLFKVLLSIFEQPFLLVNARAHAGKLRPQSFVEVGGALSPPPLVPLARLRSAF